MKNILIFCSLLFILSCNSTNKIPRIANSAENDIVASATNVVKLSSEIEWEKLNPARGDQSPQAGTIWGDRKGEVATGFLAKFVDGFSSPPHIHNVTYRAMVIEGFIHNDDPDAEKMWMSPGSFWTQPAGESHITASKGQSMAYVEIDSGPYLVKPASEAVETGELPINVASQNIIWLGSKEHISVENDDSEISILWENGDLTGRLVKLNKDFSGKLINHGDIFHAVVIRGQLNYEDQGAKVLDAGSYFTATETSKHNLNTAEHCIIYIRSNDSIEIQ